MDCRITRVKLNRDKSIGRVLFIVEGQRTEHFILKRIFSDIMQYSYIYVRRDGKKPYMKLQSSSNVNSKVFVIKSSRYQRYSDHDSRDPNVGRASSNGGRRSRS